MNTVLLTVAAMLAFAANSILARLALATGSIDAGSFSGVRLLSGAAILLILTALSRTGGPQAVRAGSWSGAATLFGYAIGFSVAYLIVGAGIGALILFATVQFAMLAFALWRGERPGPLEWIGFVLALTAFVYLISPGLVAPDPLGVLLMMGAGLCWAAYSLIGRASRAPLADTAGNFLRLAPAGAVLLVAGMLFGHIGATGVLYAVISGAIASGVGYAIWYSVLPRLARTQAAIVQLTVPAIAALGGALFLGETMDLRLILSGAGILGGVAIALLAARRRGTNSD